MTDLYTALAPIFEDQVSARLSNGTVIEGNIYIGETAFTPLEILKEDAEAYKLGIRTWFDETWASNQSEMREQILSIDANRSRFNDLEKANSRQQMMPVIGSGMSVPSGCPTWGDLLRQINNHTTLGDGELESLLADAKYEEAVDALASHSNRNLFNERVEHELRIDDPRLVDGPVRIIPALFSGIILTTNLDNVLEYTFLNSKTSFHHTLAGRDISRYRNLKSPTKRFLLKLHGDHSDPTTHVLSTDEYDDVYEAGQKIREDISLLFRTNTALFLGCSLSTDRTMQLLYETATTDPEMPRHYAFLRLPATDDERIKREQQLTSSGIFPIWYEGDHDVAITALLAGLIETE